MELCSVSATDCLVAEFSSTADPSDFVFVTVLHSCCKRKLRSTQVASHWRGPHLLNIVVMAVADGLFGLYGSERRVPATQGYRTPPPPPPSLQYAASVDVKQHQKKERMNNHI